MRQVTELHWLQDGMERDAEGSSLQLLWTWADAASAALAVSCIAFNKARPWWPRPWAGRDLAQQQLEQLPPAEPATPPWGPQCCRARVCVCVSVWSGSHAEQQLQMMRARLRGGQQRSVQDGCCAAGTAHSPAG